jgi:hypothetical protein
VEQVHFLETQAKLLKDCLTTKNAAIGEVVIGLFDDGADLEAKAKEQIEHARSRFS